ncbi:late blight resistance homolog R1A-3 isoform X1 [Olea europaea subsp. europaea]|uniref:Late blight resistance homolog R1A-3 isoform X1 n=1 Tax=Olea europaea subsp. europaea TaxID=158383 RepID=A0A8S0VFI4_OLEEU|nr:late blight resistance homolog R1A-3 isoform X1 [Olea europaea subsp. europaea]
MDDVDLAQKLYQCLKGRRYLVVIDDIWDINVWNELERQLHSDIGTQLQAFTNAFETMFSFLWSIRRRQEIPVRKLISLWIAEGYVKEEEHKCIENVALEYLMELIDRSSVLVAQRRFDGQVKTCKIHDLLREMCLKIAYEKLFLKAVTSIKILWALDIQRSGASVIGIECVVHLRYLAISSTTEFPQVESFRKLEFLVTDGLLPIEILEILLNMDTSEVEFPQLKFLKLCNVNLAEWNASSDNFPELQQLVLGNCKHLKKIHSSFSYSLQMIEIYGCTKAVKESAKQILEEQQDMGNEVLKVIILELGSEEQEEKASDKFSDR